MRISSQFSYYLLNKFASDELPSELVSISEKHRRIQSQLLYRSVVLSEPYVYFNLDSSEAISSFTSIIGELSLAGLCRRMPKLDEELDCRFNDAMNLTNKIEVYIGTNKLRLRVHACKHIIGRIIENDWFRTQLSSQPIVQADVRQVRINSKFDYNNGTYKVVNTAEQKGVPAVCIWGEQRGEGVLFDDINEVLLLVNRKRG
jgi:hypothetical protein